MKPTLYITLALVLLLTGCKKNTEEESATAVDQQEERVADVDTLALHKQTFQKQLLCNGRLAAIRRADLQCPKSGEILQSVNVQNGPVGVPRSDTRRSRHP